MTHPFVKTFHDILRNDQISLSDKMLLAALRFYCGGNSHCWPSIPTLCKELAIKERTVYYSLKRLQVLGLVQITSSPGKPNSYELLTPANWGGATPAKKTPTTPRPICTPTPAPGAETPAKKGGRKERKEKKEIKKEKNVRTCTKKLPMTKEEVQKAISSIDLGKYHSKYPETDVDGCFEDFSDHFLCKTDLKTGKPNWMLWTDWDRAFGGWMRKPWNKDRQRGKATGLKPYSEEWYAERMKDKEDDKG